MSFFSTHGILLRRIPHGDYDLIATFLTRQRGKLTLIAKNAKKSQKRFSGILEPFSQLHLVCSLSKGRSLGVLQEATIQEPFSEIRGNIIKTAYASYWAEIIHLWCEEGKAQTALYDLFIYCMNLLCSEDVKEAGASIIFQMRFLSLSGLAPDLTSCMSCKMKMEKFGRDRIVFELAKGGLVCQGCSTIHSSQQHLSKGTIKQLQWIQDNELKNLKRLKFTQPAMEEGLKFLEAFLPYHVGKEPKSLQFLRTIR